MPAPPAIEIDGLRARVDPAALADRRIEVTVEGGTLRLSGEGLVLLLPRTVPIAVERLTEGCATLRIRIKGFEGVAEVRPVASPSGRLRLELLAARASFFPIPRGLVEAAIARWLPEAPGLHVGHGNQVEIDLAEILRLLYLELPPLRAARALPGLLELEF